MIRFDTILQIDKNGQLNKFIQIAIQTNIYLFESYINQSTKIKSCPPEETPATFAERRVISPENAPRKDQKEITTEKPEHPEMPPSVTTAKVPATSPENAHQKDKKDKRDLSDPETPRVATSASTVVISATLPENAPKNPEKERTERTERTEVKTTENVTTARRLVTSQETALKVATERKTSNATSVTKTDISQEIAKIDSVGRSRFTIQMQGGI